MLSASEQIDAMIANLPDWRGRSLANIRHLTHEADPEVLEEWKWRGAPVFSDHGILFVANAFKDKVKVTFYSGADLPDPDQIFNNGLDGNQWRTIDLSEGDVLKEEAFKALVQAAVEFNKFKKAKPAAKKKTAR